VRGCAHTDARRTSPVSLPRSSPPLSHLSPPSPRARASPAPRAQPNRLIFLRVPSIPRVVPTLSRASTTPNRRRRASYAPSFELARGAAALRDCFPDRVIAHFRSRRRVTPLVPPNPTRVERPRTIARLIGHLTYTPLPQNINDVIIRRDSP